MRRLLILLLFALPVYGQTVVPIQNPSFEAALVQNGGIIPGWDAHQAPGGGYSVIQWSTAPDGHNVAYLAYGTSISQDLKVLPQVGVYTLKIWVGNWLYSYAASYVVSITIGSKPVCSTQGYTLGDFSQPTLVCPMPSNIVNGHDFGFAVGNLGISASSNTGGIITERGWPLLVDNFSLTFTPVN